jgi:signal transduction histidine kinase
MFSRLLPERLPSTWRLAVLQCITIATSIALCLTLAAMALRADLETISRRILLDDLGEYSSVYEMTGKAGVTRMFESGRHETDEALRITDADSKVLHECVSDPKRPFPWPAPTLLHKLPDVKDIKSIEHPDGQPGVLIGRVFLSDGKVMWYGRTNQADRAYVEHIKLYLWYAGVAAALIALVPVFWYAGEVLQPVRSMIASAKALARGSGRERLAASSAVPELREFASAFNTVLDRNEELAIELQAANDQLAHELRTPLARIRGNLEAFHDTADEGVARDSAARGLDEIDRASSLVQTILTVRAGEHRALVLHREQLSVRGLLADIVDLYVISAEDRGVVLRLDAPEDRTLGIDQQRLTQAIANLLDNALTYTPSGGTITIKLEFGADVCTIHVLDTGPGIKPGEEETIWQRFVRGSAASAKSPGMGLGLSLVRAVATAHGGNAGARTRDEGGSDFWITLPAQGPS